MADGIRDPLKQFTSERESSQDSQNNSDEVGKTWNQVQTEYLKSIDQTTKAILSRSTSMSQTDARDAYSTRDDFRQRERNRRSGNTGSDRSNRSFWEADSFTDQFEKAILEGFFGSDFEDKIGEAVNSFADAFGVNLKTIRGDIGRELGKQAMSAFQDSDIGKNIMGSFNDVTKDIKSRAQSAFMDGLSKYDQLHPAGEGQSSYTDAFRKWMNRSAAETPSGTSMSGAGGAGSSGAGSVVSDMSQSLVQDAGEEILGTVTGTADAASAVTTAATTFAEGTSGVGAIISGLGPVIAAFGPELLIATAAVAAVDIAFDLLVKAITPAIDGLKKYVKQLDETAKREQTSRAKNLTAEEDRLAADVKTLIEEPFEILKDAANELYDAWKNNIEVINATQGYTKSDLQALIGNYAERLRSEGLESVVSSADITENLASVLESGLSGYAAEEFAYIATILNKAIPTQDFFQYADTYAELAGTMLSQGYSEAQAVSYANTQLEAFANNILYANRNLAGGFTTGLKDASGLLEDAVKIAQSAKTGDVNTISAVLTAVSAATGSIAPDLASSMVDAVVKAATGGNSSELVALRSLSGVNASNTEFLRKLAEDPQGIFTELFTNLSTMQNMSNDAFMEVAEGLSSVFGISMEAFARIDFNYLADAISNMNASSGSLEENMKLIASGQTTTTKEALKIQQINEYMIDEGLAYLIDNEFAQMIQQHMWDEQIARQLMEAQYAVELKGSALEFLEGLATTVTNILNFLNPFMWLGKAVTNIVATSNEFDAQRADIVRILEAGKVGNGNAKDLRNLTTTGIDLHLTGSLAELLTGFSAYDTASAARQATNALFSPIFAAMDGATALSSYGVSSLINSSNSSYSGRRSSAYTWGTVGKSVAATALSTTASPSDAAVTASGSSISTKSQSEAAEEAANKALVAKLSKAVDLMGDRTKNASGVEEMKYASYEDWKKVAQKRVSDWDGALEAAGITESQLESQFQNEQAKYGAEIQQQRLDYEYDFWTAGKDFWRADEFRVREFEFWDITMQYQVDELAMTTNIFTLIQEETNGLLTKINTQLKTFYNDWVDYYIRYTTYGTGTGELNAAGRRTYSYSDVATIANKEKNESYDAVHALAEALNKNIVDLHDPQVQTNALLAKILLVAEALLQQSQTGDSGTSTYDSLVALATGKL